MSDSISPQRRRLLASLAMGVAAIPLLRVSSAQAADLPHLKLSNPTATALHYTEDASTLTAKAEPAYKKGADCANCMLYQGDRKAAWGPCAVFPGKDVKATGWCSSHADMAD